MALQAPRDIGLLVRETRRGHGLTQAQLAAHAGVGREWIVALERGNRGAELGRVLQVLAALGLTLDVATPSRPSRIDAIVDRAARRGPRPPRR